MLYRSRRVVLESGVQEAGILVGDEGKILAVLQDKRLDAFVGPQEDLGDLVLMAGLVDSHVHVNEPGRAHWEGYSTATAAAAAGGVTTILDMPLNSIPPTTTVDNLRTKLEAARGKLHVDVGFWGGVVPGNEGELRPLVQAGVVGFKCFLCPSGVDEFPHVSSQHVDMALSQLRGTGSVLAFHAELCEDAVEADKTAGPGVRHQYQTFLQSRPASMELAAVRLVTDMCQRHGVSCHIVHLSAAEAVPLLRKAKQDGARLTVETCHHYLTLAAEDIPDGGTQYKCCPPVRDRKNRSTAGPQVIHQCRGTLCDGRAKELLWTALAEGVVDMVVSDHSPCTPDLKLLPPLGDGDFLEAWGGISSLQFGLSLFWSQAKERGFSMNDVSRQLSASPARLCGLQHLKGQLREGMDADMVVWDPDKTFQVTESIIQYRNKVTPYLGKKLHGLVVRTILRGQTVYELGKPITAKAGKLLLEIKH